jgi:hypothetical protein
MLSFRCPYIIWHTGPHFENNIACSATYSVGNKASLLKDSILMMMMMIMHGIIHGSDERRKSIGRNLQRMKEF